MPVVTSVPGAILFTISMAAFLVQEFSQGIGTPGDAEVADERAAVWYLEVLPVVLVGVAIVCSVRGLGVLPAPVAVFVVGLLWWWAGLAVRQWSHVTLGAFHQGVVTIHEDHTLAEHGPYRSVRHPMYAGSLLAFVGVGLALGTWPGLVLCTVGVAPGVLRRITVEERAMRTALGAEYEEYASGRARLVPGIW